MFFFISSVYNALQFDLYHKKNRPKRVCFNSAKGTRTLVTGVRGQCPVPLDDGTELLFSVLNKRRQI